MKSVVQRTGLSAHVIRIWEKRYEAVKPTRTGSNRRLYSDEQVRRLELLRDLSRAGHSIGVVAKLGNDELIHLAKNAKATANQSVGPGADTASTLLEECVDAVKSLSSIKLDHLLKRGSAELGAQGLLQRVIAPLAHRIGEMWRDGSLTAAHEHFASAVIRVFLGHAAKPFAAAESAPVLVVGTPTGQLHELGALLAGAAAANLGWQVNYLGPSLPAGELAGATLQSRARALALSLVYPEDDPRLEAELSRLRELLPPGFPILIGGRAMPAYRSALEKIGAHQVKDLSHLSVLLDSLRKPA